ncbi:hypothetical protein [Arthrobacter sp. RAF14]|uniref:hypothetical protein n=1 Tax=Arthrobacter sp. RAF14 TaxID=3233051 RepID=UPI003F8DBFCC
MKKKQIVTVVFALSGLLTSVAACGAQQPSPPTSGGHMSSPGAATGWAAKVSGDPYAVYKSADLLAISSAFNELRYKCLGENGYPQFLQVLPAQKANSFRNMEETPDFAATFASYGELPWFASEQDARAKGYGLPAQALAPTVMTMDPAIGPVMNDCTKKSLAAVGDRDGTIQNYTELGNTLAGSMGSITDKAKGDLTNQVLACMNKGKYPVDPNGANKNNDWNVDFLVPLGVQPPQLNRDDSGMNGNAVIITPAIPAKPYVPTKEESESAAAMYHCSVETGAHDEWLNDIHQAEATAISQNEAALDELNPKIAALAKSASAALQGHGK